MCRESSFLWNRDPSICDVICGLRSMAMEYMGLRRQNTQDICLCCYFDLCFVDAPLEVWKPYT